MTVWRKAQVALAVGAGVVFLAWIGCGFAIGFGWRPPETWNITALGMTSYVVFAVCLIGVPVVSAIRLEVEE